tara:strand:- start:962 stop:1309 length:348 start_codon:yes stop_codon:yes gene_type:complete
MSWFIKTEKFTSKTLVLPQEIRRRYIKEHKNWVRKMKAAGINIYSGFLVNEKKEPGGGGMLLLEANCYKEAENFIQKDPMILNDLVIWQLQEWISINSEFQKDNNFTLDDNSLIF